ncbi:MAG TPA: hypothetical protein VJH89_01275 [Patescibacteria group bacterium]|nr:hypothetical protein [Patescibacteria group bacterium]
MKGKKMDGRLLLPFIVALILAALALSQQHEQACTACVMKYEEWYNVTNWTAAPKLCAKACPTNARYGAPIMLVIVALVILAIANGIAVANGQEMNEAMTLTMMSTFPLVTIVESCYPADTLDYSFLLGGALVIVASLVLRCIVLCGMTCRKLKQLDDNQIV